MYYRCSSLRAVWDTYEWGIRAKNLLLYLLVQPYATCQSAYKCSTQHAAGYVACDQIHQPHVCESLQPFSGSFSFYTPALSN